METTKDLPQFKKQWFYSFLFLYAFIWVIVPGLSYETLPRDVTEELMWGSRWELGYFKHPFLTSWLVHLFHLIFPLGDWSFYLLSQGAVIICFGAIWRLGNKIMTPMESFLSIVIMSLAYYYHAAIFEFNPNVLMLPLWALALCTFYSAIRQNKIDDWISTGLWLGLGLITKYETAVLIAVMGLFIISTPEGRASLKLKGPYCAAAVGLLILLPNLIWIYKNNFEPIRYFLQRIDHTTTDKYVAFYARLNVFRFIGSQLLILLPTFIAFLLLCRCPTKKNSLSTFDKKFLLMAGLGPFLLTILFALIFGAELHDNWGTPFFSALGLFLIGWRRPEISRTVLRQLSFFCLSLIFLMAVAIGIGTRYGPIVSERLINRAHFPGKALALEVTELWHQHYSEPLPYIAGEYDLVNYIAAYSPDHPIGYSDWDKKESPWIDETLLRKKGAMFVWIDREPFKGQFPPEIKNRFPNAVLLTEIKMHYLTPYRFLPVTFGIAILPTVKSTLRRPAFHDG